MSDTENMNNIKGKKKNNSNKKEVKIISKNETTNEDCNHNHIVKRTSENKELIKSLVEDFQKTCMKFDNKMTNSIKWKFHALRIGKGDVSLLNLPKNVSELMFVAEISGVEELTHSVSMIMPINHINSQDKILSMGMYFGPTNYIGVYLQVIKSRIYLKDSSANGVNRLSETILYVYYR